MNTEIGEIDEDKTNCVKCYRLIISAISTYDTSKSIFFKVRIIVVFLGVSKFRYISVSVSEALLRDI